MAVYRCTRLGTVLAVILCCLLSTDSALAQLSSEDIEALRQRGIEEGWTFEVGESEATSYSLDQLCGLVIPDNYRPDYSNFHSRAVPPDSWDWRDMDGVNYCTPIRSQGGCGSCWAFSAIGSMEASIRINWGVYVDLSEQWLVSCTDSGNCEGGWYHEAWNYLMCDGTPDYCNASGAVMEDDYPYQAAEVPCGCPFMHPYCLMNWEDVPNSVVPIKQAIMEYGPLSVALCVNDAFHGYDGGVFNDCSGTEINHAVVLVGWDDSMGSEGVWIMRNSWGTGWGDNGYMYIEYGCSCIGYAAAYIDYGSTDCNLNSIPDSEDIAGGLSEDCNYNGLPDECESQDDCNENGITDICELGDGTQFDCNENGVLDVCDLEDGTSPDCNANGIPDECDVADGTSWDCDQNGILDDCEGGVSGINPILVDIDANGAGTGANWDDAVPSLYTALCKAEHDSAITQIWVAEGTYKPTSANGNRHLSFDLVSGVTVYGGFAGWEEQVDQRHWESNLTILSGDLNGNDWPNFANNAENSHHVVTGSGCDQTAVLDGVIIRGGNANGEPPEDNRGGGMLNADGSPTLVNCTFLSNEASWIGGAVYNDGGAGPTFISCVFSGNQSDFLGGGVANESALSILRNCTFSMNHASSHGGGVYSDWASVASMANCVLWNNSDLGGTDLSAQIHGSTDGIHHSCIQGWLGFYGGTTGDDPQFVDADGPDNTPGTSDDNLRLTGTSPCINTGANYVPGLPSKDIKGDNRIQNCGVDMGAYESPYAPTSWDDCNTNSQDDDCDVLYGYSLDCNSNDVPDECESLELGDFNSDGYMSLADYTSFVLCMGGPQAAPAGVPVEMREHMPRRVRLR